MTRETSCEARWQANKDDRLDDLRKLLAAWHDGDEDRHAAELGTLGEYGLGFDYVAPDTFADQKEGYWRYQISWGGPSDEFRFYAGGHGELSPHRISYVFLDWFDGHERTLADNDLVILHQLWDFFRDAGVTQTEYRNTIQRDHD
jgi:hypothetical protein